MRIYNFLVIILTILSATFFCSESPFDTDTNLGSDILNDKDPLLTIFDAKFCEDTLDLTKGSSLVDIQEPDSLISGLHKRSHLTLFNEVTKKYTYPVYCGTWNNEQAYVYLQFDGSKIEEWLETINSNADYQLLSFSFIFNNLDYLSDATENTLLEIGYYDGARKSENEKIDITKLKEIANYSYDGSSETTHSISMKTEYIDTTLPVRTITSQKFINGVIRTIEEGFDSLNALDTIKDTITYINDIVIYDSIATISQLVKEGQAVAISLSDSSAVGDTTFYRDTVITVPETTVVYTIDTIQGQDTSETTEYDTTAIVSTISQDTIVQFSKKSFKESLIFKASNPEWWDTTGSETIKNICMYISLDALQTNSVQFLDNVNLRLKYLKTASSDTVTKTLKTSYYDVSVFETDPLSLDTSAQSSGAAGRYTLLEIDLKPVWESMKDSSGEVIYRNFPRASLTLFPDSIALHKSALATTSFRYALLDSKVTNIEDVEKFNQLSSITESQKETELTIKNFVIDMLYSSDPLPETGYLYIGMYPHHLARITWETQNGRYPVRYIISNRN